MGNRIHNTTRFLLRNLMSGSKKATQFAINTGRSIAAGAKDAVNDVEPFDLYDAPKPQATRNKK